MWEIGFHIEGGPEREQLLRACARYQPVRFYIFEKDYRDRVNYGWRVARILSACYLGETPLDEYRIEAVFDDPDTLPSSVPIAFTAIVGWRPNDGVLCGDIGPLEW